MPETVATRYAAMLAQTSIIVPDASGGLDDWTRVLDRARGLLDSGRDSEAETLLRVIAEGVKEGRK